MSGLLHHSQNKCSHDILSTEPHRATTLALKVPRTTLAFLRLDQATGTMTPCLFANLRHSVATTKVPWYELLFFDVAKEASEKAQKVACCKKGELTRLLKLCSPHRNRNKNIACSRSKTAVGRAAFASVKAGSPAGEVWLQRRDRSSSEVGA